jgi:hypothetical protein
MIALLLSLATAGAVEPGRYGLELVLGSDADLPFLGRTPGTSRSWSLVDVLATDAGLVQHHQTCAVRMEGRTGSTSVHIPPAFVAALPRRVVPVAGGPQYRADMGEDAVGYDPQRGALPTAIDDGAVIDWDGDGAPAATVELHIPILGVIRLFVAQRAHIRLAGEEGADGIVRGGVEVVRFEQNTLGASSALFDHSPKVTPRADRSSFRLIPMPAVAGCAALRPAFCARGDSVGACAED